jgi:hypothetical protein
MRWHFGLVHTLPSLRSDHRSTNGCDIAMERFQSGVEPGRGRYRILMLPGRRDLVRDEGGSSTNCRHHRLFDQAEKLSVALSMAWRSARCSNRRFEGLVCRHISVQITIRCIGFINGRPTSESRAPRKSTLFHTPWSHPFVERLIVTVRRECLTGCCSGRQRT